MPLPEREETPELAFTGERFIPHHTDPLLALEHYHRYFCASRLAKGKRILDIACGEGYGSALLSKWAGEIVGVDIDEATIAHARKRYATIENLVFETGHCKNTPGSAEPFDMVVSFELVEHLDPEDQVGFLKNVKRLLRRDGIFIVSSPEKAEYAATYEARNEYHKHEMTLLELQSFLGGFFKYVHLCAQRTLFVSAMWQLEHWRESPFHFHPRKDLLDEIPESETLAQPLYLIALCSNEPIPASVLAECNSFYLDISNSDQTKTFSRWAQQLNSEAAQNRQIIQALRQELERREREYRSQIEERTAWAQRLDGQIKGKDELISTLKTELIEMVKIELDQRAKWAFSLEAELNREREMQKKSANQLNTVTSSLVYRLLSRLRLLPRY